MNGTQLIALLAGLLALQGAAPAGALEARGEPSIRLGRAGNVYEIEARAQVAAAPGEVWAVLTDYERLGLFVPSVLASRVVARREDGLVLEQRVLGRVLFIERQLRVRLHIRERAPHALSFRDEASADFVLYEGSWTLEARPPGVWLTYRLRAQPRAQVPDFVGNGAFERGARELIEQVVAEVRRRGGRAKKDTGEAP